VRGDRLPGGLQHADEPVHVLRQSHGVAPPVPPRSRQHSGDARRLDARPVRRGVVSRAVDDRPVRERLGPRGRRQHGPIAHQQLQLPGHGEPEQHRRAVAANRLARLEPGRRARHRVVARFLNVHARRCEEYDPELRSQERVLRGWKRRPVRTSGTGQARSRSTSRSSPARLPARSRCSC
jgi:hypothetical protein